VMNFSLLSVLVSLRTSYSAIKPVALCYWYSAWRRARAARRTRVKLGTVVTSEVMRLAADDGCARRRQRNKAPGDVVVSARRWRYCEGTVGA